MVNMSEVQDPHLTRIYNKYSRYYGIIKIFNHWKFNGHLKVKQYYLFEDRNNC